MEGTLVPFLAANGPDTIPAQEPSMKLTPEQSQAQYKFRVHLWKEFVAHYQTGLSAAPESFSTYCETFRAKWVAEK